PPRSTLNETPSRALTVSDFVEYVFVTESKSIMVEPSLSFVLSANSAGASQSGIAGPVQQIFSPLFTFGGLRRAKIDRPVERKEAVVVVVEIAAGLKASVAKSHTCTPASPNER